MEPIIAKAGGGSRIMAPAGLHRGVMCDIRDYGQQLDERYKKVTHPIRFYWLLEPTIPGGVWVNPHTGEEKQVPEELVGKHFSVSRKFNLTLSEKATLRQFLAAWRGKDFTPEQLKGFDITKLLDISCMVNVVHAPGKRDPSQWYDNVAGCTPMPAGMEPFLTPESYVRFEDRQLETEPPAGQVPPPPGYVPPGQPGFQPGAGESWEPEDEDDPLPF